MEISEKIINRKLKQAQKQLLKEGANLNYNDLYALAAKKLKPILALKVKATKEK